MRTNLAHEVQLKKEEIRRYCKVIANYPPRRMEKCGRPYLARLERQLRRLEIALGTERNK